MVKAILKAGVSRVFTAKRVRGIKTKNTSTNSRKKTKAKDIKIKSQTLDIDYYLKPKIIDLLTEEDQNIKQLREQEESEFVEYMEYIDSFPNEVKNYSQEHRVKAIISLNDLINQVVIQLTKKMKEQSQGNPDSDKNFPDNFEFSVLALFERYLYKVGKDLSKNELMKAFICCLIYIDKEQNLCVFNSSFFNQKFPFELDLSFLSIVDLVIYPVKIYDYFEIFYLRISQQKKGDKNYQKYIEKFKGIFIELNFYFVFNENSKMKKPSSNFISCLYLTYNFLKNNNSLENETVLCYINHYKEIMKYNIQDYYFSKDLLLDSKKVYDEFASKLTVDKTFKEGLINNINIKCI